jgi:hypothetical protein
MNADDQVTVPHVVHGATRHHWSSQNAHHSPCCSDWERHKLCINIACGHNSHHTNPLMMETETVSETSHPNSTLTWTVPREDNCKLSSWKLQIIYKMLLINHINAVCDNFHDTALFTKSNFSTNTLWVL